MTNALEAFRAQREAVEDLHSRVREVAGLLNQIQREVSHLTSHHQLREFLNEQRAWLARTEESISRLRALRQSDMYRVGRSIVWRWAVAVLFAVSAIAVAAAAYGWMARTKAADVALLHERARFAENIERRLGELTPAERRQFERLMRLAPPP